MGEALLCSILCLKSNESEENEGNNMRTKYQRALMFQGCQGFDCSLQVGWLNYHPRIQAFPFPSANAESFKAPQGIQKKRSTISDHRSVQNHFFQVVE